MPNAEHFLVSSKRTRKPVAYRLCLGVDADAMSGQAYKQSTPCSRVISCVSRNRYLLPFVCDPNPWRSLSHRWTARHGEFMRHYLSPASEAVSGTCGLISNWLRSSTASGCWGSTLFRMAHGLTFSRRMRRWPTLLRSDRPHLHGQECRRLATSHVLRALALD